MAMTVRELIDALVVVERDKQDPQERLTLRYRVDPDLRVVVVPEGREPGLDRADVVRFVVDGGPDGEDAVAELWVEDHPDLISHKLTGTPKPDKLAQLEARLERLEAGGRVEHPDPIGG